MTKLRDVDMLQRDLSSVTKPIYLQFDGKKSEGRFIIGLLMSLSETDERVTVVPYSNNNDEGKMYGPTAVLQGSLRSAKRPQ